MRTPDRYNPSHKPLGRIEARPREVQIIEECDTELNERVEAQVPVMQDPTLGMDWP
jgi:hypothetical protein